MTMNCIVENIKQWLFAITENVKRNKRKAQKIVQRHTNYK